jgi:hypothetical protein
VILEASIAQSQAEDSLAQQLLDRVLDLAGVAGVSEAGGKALDDSSQVIDLAQQQSSAVGSDSAPIESSDDLATSRSLKQVLLGCTVCLQELSPFVASK